MVIGRSGGRGRDPSASPAARARRARLAARRARRPRERACIALSGSHNRRVPATLRQARPLRSRRARRPGAGGAGRSAGAPGSGRRASSRRSPRGSHRRRRARDRGPGGRRARAARQAGRAGEPVGGAPARERAHQSRPGRGRGKLRRVLPGAARLLDRRRREDVSQLLPLYRYHSHEDVHGHPEWHLFMFPGFSGRKTCTGARCAPCSPSAA